MQFSYGFGPLMVVSLTGSAGLAGLSVALIGISRFLVAYPMGGSRIARTQAGHPSGLSLALLGALMLGSAMMAHSIVLFVIGLLAFGMGMSASQQMRVAATDMFPPSMRGQALGYVALGSLGGLLLSPTLVFVAEPIGRQTGLDPLGLPWFFLPISHRDGMFIISFVRPDPKVIGMNLKDYWPDYAPSEKKGSIAPAISAR